MLKQYHDLKAQHQECILLYRLGDFYEMFYEDAVIAAKCLDLVLTSRGKNSSTKVPMCGFPYHAAENYIARLIKAGHKVAICEQMEDPSQAQGIVKRDVTRIITSGTYLDENNTDARYLLALCPNEQSIGISFIDPVIGTIQTNQFRLANNHLIQILAKLPIQECIFPEEEEDRIKKIFNHPVLKAKQIPLSPYSDWCFNPNIAKKSLCEHFAVHNLHGFGIEELSSAISSTGALLEYLKQMNKQPLHHIDKISLYSNEDYIYISPAAYRGLELDSLIKTLNNTLTPLGKRCFQYWFLHPLKDIVAIKQRQDAIKLLKENHQVLEQIKNLFHRIGDVEKNISRLSCGYTHAKDLLAIRGALSLLPQIRSTVKDLQNQNNLFQCEDIKELRAKIILTINEDIPLSKPEGKVISKGINQELDELKNIQNNGKEWLKEYQQKEIKRTGINSLKIGFNKVFGYYMEVTKVHAAKVPPDFIRKQTLVNAERYITPQLKEYEEKILSAQDKIYKIENEIIQEICKDILDNSKNLHSYCQSIATIDTLYSLTLLAQEQNYIMPEMSEDTLIDIKDGRHPFVEKTITDSFVPNDTLLDSEHSHLIILTGPNMAGKSTYIRQTAILVLMAQVGSFIPARCAHIGFVDKIFTRIGAHDDISKGQSTFMVEMNEMADILSNLTDRSLVVLDEIGRGTSTYDGLSLAWALAEHLQTTKARTLFATHFHELTALADKFLGVKNYNVAVKEWKDEIIFLHKIIEGSTDDSYGIYVAKLAGVPKNIISRAKQVLTHLELKNDLKENLKSESSSEEQMNFLNEMNESLMHEVKDSLDSTDINEITPVEAMNRLVELKKLIEKES